MSHKFCSVETGQLLSSMSIKKSLMCLVGSAGGQTNTIGEVGRLTYQMLMFIPWPYVAGIWPTFHLTMIVVNLLMRFL